MNRPDETLSLPHPVPVRDLAPGTVVGGKYRIESPIGAGGMGAVYLATDTGPLARSCAVKFLADSSPAARARFLAEARIMATLRHPNIVPVTNYGIDEATGFVWYAMDEFLPSPAETVRLCREVLRCPLPAARPGPAPLSLARLLDGGKTLPEETVVAVARELLSAIEAAHALSPPVIHRDIKPSNILFAADGRALLADFGIAKRLAAPGETRTLPGATPGTPAYAAPEQLAGESVTPAADFYSFGVVLFRALTGGMPGPTAALPVDIASGVSRAWRELFSRILAREPDKRLSDAAGLKDFFDKISRDIAAQKRRRVLRRPALASAALLVLLGGMLAALQLSRRPSAPETAPAGPPLPASEEDTPFGELSAKTWVRRYADSLQALLDRAVEPVPDEANRIRVGKGQVVLSGDLAARGEEAPAVLLDGGTLLVSPSRAALREILAKCADYLEKAPDWVPLPAFLPALSRDTVSAPILVGDGGGELDALDTAMGIDFPESLPKAPRPDGWQDLAKFDLFFASPIRPADGLAPATLRIAADAPDIAFSGLDSRIRVHRLPGTGN
ncbi:MAG: serine/threonine protein kinase [Kiritimatiellae bacterium]|nr:serine/threonine protein kinase [Kiritimatiellia bacterium]